jgi:hypothetical protein
MKTRLTLIALLLTVVAFAGFADSHMEKPAMMKQVEYFNGGWQCSGKAFASPMTKEHATKAKVTSKWIYGGNWLQFEYLETKTATNPTPYAVQGYFGYDAEQKKIVSGTVDAMGGYATTVSSGWNGDTIIFTGPSHMGAMTANGRDTFVKKGQSEMWHSFEIEDKGKWMKLAEESCKR